MDVFSILDEVQATARGGLHWAESPFDRERYEHLLALAVGEYAERTGLPAPEIQERFAAEVGQITPKVGADAAIFDDDDRILLVLRTDDRRWGLVAGWVDPNEHPSVTAVREAKEEVGLDIAVDRLAGLVHRPASADAGPHSALSVVYLCSVVAGDIIIQPHEVVEARWWVIDEVENWHLNHEELARFAWEARRSTR